MNELLPGFAADVFHSGAGGLSIMASAIGGGAILGGLWLGHRGIRPADLGRARRFACGRAGGDLRDRNRDLWVAVPALVVFGFCMSTAGIAIQTLIQLATDRSMRGRVMGLYGLIFRGAPAVGALGAGACIGAFRAALAGFLRRSPGDRGLLWTYLSRERIAAALPSPGPGCRGVKHFTGLGN